MTNKIKRVGMFVSSILTIMSFGACTNEDITPVPEIKALVPNALTWEAGDTGSKNIEVSGTDLDGAMISVSALQNYTTSVNGTTITVTPKSANATEEDVVETLTVSVEGGNSLGATLTQLKKVVEPEPDPVPSLTSLTPDALTWGADEVDAKTITVAGENLDGVTLTVSDLTAFTATVEGTVITVTPNAANTATEDVVETLTVTAGESSLTATLTQSKAEAVEPDPVPSLTSLTPDALTWGADEVDAKTITVAGENLDGVTLTVSDLTAFTATVEGTVITVTPKAANTAAEDVVETLTVTAGESSLTATLTQSKAEAVEPDPNPGEPTSGWKKVTDNRDDWSGTYLIVAEVEPLNPRAWKLEEVASQGNPLFLTVEDGRIVSAGLTNMGKDENGITTNSGDVELSSLSQYAVTIAKVDGGYSIMIPSGQYITNTTGKAGIEFVEESAVGATSITKSDDNTFKIENTNSTTLFGWYNVNRKFNFFPVGKWDNTRSQVSFYEYVAE